MVRTPRTSDTIAFRLSGNAAFLFCFLVWLFENVFFFFWKFDLSCCLGAGRRRICSVNKMRRSRERHALMSPLRRTLKIEKKTKRQKRNSESNTPRLVFCRCASPKEMEHNCTVDKWPWGTSSGARKINIATLVAPVKAYERDVFLGTTHKKAITCLVPCFVQVLLRNLYLKAFSG